MANHLTPDELSKEVGIDREEVIRIEKIGSDVDEAKRALGERSSPELREIEHLSRYQGSG